jgi:hypothetical protein
VFDHSLSVSVMRFARTELASATISVSDAAQSFSAGEALARKLDRPGLRAVFVLYRGPEGEWQRAGARLQLRAPPLRRRHRRPGGRWHPLGRTWVFTRDKVQSGLVTAVGFYGEHLLVAHGSKGGWDAFGPAQGDSLRGQRPLRAGWQARAGPLQAVPRGQGLGLPATGLLFPLALRQPGDEEKFLVRTLLAVDAAKNSMTFAGDIPRAPSSS